MQEGWPDSEATRRRACPYFEEALKTNNLGDSSRSKSDECWLSQSVCRPFHDYRAHLHLRPNRTVQFPSSPIRPALLRVRESTVLRWDLWPNLRKLLSIGAIA
jgi:hypothetical protein